MLTLRRLKTRPRRVARAFNAASARALANARASRPVEDEIVLGRYAKAVYFERDSEARYERTTSHPAHCHVCGARFVSLSDEFCPNPSCPQSCEITQTHRP